MKKLLALMLSAALCLSLLSACGNKQEEEKPVDLAAFAQTLLDDHGLSDFLERADPEDQDVGAVMLENCFPGLLELDLEQMEVYLNPISFGAGEFALAQAKSADDASAVKDIFQARIDAKSQEGRGNYPEEVEIWQRNAQVAVNGSYVMLVCAEDHAAIVGEFNALFQG